MNIRGFAPLVKLLDLVKQESIKDKKLTLQKIREAKALIEEILQSGTDLDVKNYGFRKYGPFGPYGQYDLYNATLLWHAARNGHTTIVSLLLNAGAKPDTACAMGNRALTLAVKNGHTNIVRLLLNAGAKAISADGDDSLLIMMAALKRHSAIFKLLLDNIDVDTRDNRGFTVLRRTAKNGLTDLVSILLAKGATPDIPGDGAITPLIFAAEGGFTEIVRLLLANGANPDKPDDKGRTPLISAAAKGYTEIVRLLLANGANPDKPDRKGDDVTRWSYPVEGSIDAVGRTPLTYAARNGHPDIVSLLLDKDAKPDTPDGTNRTALEWANINNLAGIVRLLLLNKNSNPSSSVKTWLLSCAADRGHINIVRLLLAKNVEPDESDIFDDTPLTRAARNNHPDIVSLLLDKVILDTPNATPGLKISLRRYLLNYPVNSFPEILLLNHIDLSNVTFGKKQIKQLLSVWHTNSKELKLRTLNLSNTGMTRDDLTHLNAFIKEYISLQELYLNSNLLGGTHFWRCLSRKSGIEQLLEALHDYPALKKLEIQNNGLDKQDAYALLSMLESREQAISVNYEPLTTDDDTFDRMVPKAITCINDRADFLAELMLPDATPEWYLKLRNIKPLYYSDNKDHLYEQYYVRLQFFCDLLKQISVVFEPFPEALKIAASKNKQLSPVEKLQLRAPKLKEYAHKLQENLSAEKLSRYNYENCKNNFVQLIKEFQEFVDLSWLKEKPANFPLSVILSNLEAQSAKLSYSHNNYEEEKLNASVARGLNNYYNPNVSTPDDIQQVITSNYTIFKARKNGSKYALNITAESLESDHHFSTAFIDPDENKVIALFRRDEKGFLFLFYDTSATLNISGKLKRNSYEFINELGELSVSADLSAQGDLSISTRASAFEFNGKIDTPNNLCWINAGKLSISKDSEISAAKHLILLGHELLLQGKIQGQESCVLNLKGRLFLENEAECKSEMSLYIKAAAVPELRGKILSGRALKLEASDSIYLRGAAQITAEGHGCDLLVCAVAPTKEKLDNLAIHSNTAYILSDEKLYYVNKATQACSEVELVAKKLAAFKKELKPADSARLLTVDELKKIRSITGHDHYSSPSLEIKAKSLHASSKSMISSKETIKLDVNQQLIIDKESTWLAYCLLFNAETFRNESPYLKASQARIYVKNDFTNYSSGTFTTENNLFVTGGSLWNSGQLNYGQDFKANINHIFAHGIVNASDVYQRIRESKYQHVARACIQGKNTRISAGVFVNFIGLIKVNNFTLNSIAEINFGMLVTITESKSRLLKFDAGITLPNLMGIADNLTNFIGLIKQGEYHKALWDLCSWNSAMQGASFLRWILRKFVPVLGKPIDFIWTLVILISKTPSLYATIKELYKQENATQPYQYYELLGIATNALTQGISAEMQGDSLFHEPLGEIQFVIPPQTALTLAGDLASLVLSNSSSESLIDLNAGSFHIAPSMSNYSAFSYSLSNARVGLNISDFNLISHQTQALALANNMSATGYSLDRSGLYIANSTFTNVQEQNENSLVIANQVYWSAKHLTVTGHLVVNGSGQLKAEQKLDMTPESQVTGDGNVAFVAPEGNLGHVNLSGMSIKFDHVPDIEDLLLARGIYKNVTVHESIMVSTQDKVLIQTDMHPNYSIGVTAPSIRIESTIEGKANVSFYSTDGSIANTKDITANGTLEINSHDDYRNEGGKVSAKVTLIHSYNNALNNGGTWLASQYLQVTTNRGNIVNQVLEQEASGQYSPIKIYTPAQIIGGTGEGYGGVGAHLQAGNKVINDASIISSIGSNYISGRNGIESTARSYNYVSYYKEWNNFFSKKYTIEFSTKVQTAGIYSSQGNNVLVSDQGGINSCATNFVAKGNTSLSAKGDIKTTELVATTRCYKDQKNPLSHYKKTEIDEYAVPTVIVSDQNTSIVSLANVELHSAALITGGNLDIKAHNLEVSAPILNHTYQQDAYALSLQLPNLSALPGYAMLQDIQAARRANKGTEAALSGWNLAMDSFNTMNNALTSLRTLSLSPAFCPSVGLDLSHTRSTMHQQTLDTNSGIYASGSLRIQADNKVSFNGAPIVVGGDFDIEADIFEQNGVKLHSDQTTASQGTTLTTTLFGDFGGAVHASHNASQQDVYSNQSLQVNGNATFKVNHLLMQDANTIVNGSISGKINEVSIVSHLNSSSNHSWNAQISTMSNVDYQQSSGRTAWIGTVSGMQAGVNLDLEINKAYLEGAKITAGGENHLQIHELESQEVQSYNQGHNYGISTNMKDIYSPHCAQAMPLFNVNWGKVDYYATQESTIYGNKGTFLQMDSLLGSVNTNNALGFTVTRNINENYLLKLPIITAVGTEAIMDNLSWVEGKADSLKQHFIAAASKVNKRENSTANSSSPSAADDFSDDDLPELLDNENNDDSAIVSTKENEHQYLLDRERQQRWRNTLFSRDSWMEQDNYQVNDEDFQSDINEYVAQPNKNSRVMEYVDGFNSGVEKARDSLVNTVRHPIDIVTNLAITSWDGYNVIGDQLFGVSTEGSRARNASRGQAINQGIDNFVNGDGPTKTRILSETIASAVFAGGLGVAVGGMGFAGLEAGGYAIKTPYGYAYQEFSSNALAARMLVQNKGATLFRRGKIERWDENSTGQFWAAENPANSGYAQRYGIPLENMNYNYIQSGSLKPGEKFITRKAPGVGGNAGGAIEIVTNDNSVNLRSFHLR